MKTFLILLTVLTFSAIAQFRDSYLREDPRKLFLSPSAGTVFDMSRLSVSHSVSMGYFSSGRHSVLLNEYTAGIKYRISDPLTLRLNLGLSYTPYSSLSSVSEEQTDFSIRSASLDYRPSESFRLRVDFVNSPSFQQLHCYPFGLPENNR